MSNEPRTEVVLASASPRRTELLSAMGLPHRVMPGAVDENVITADHPRTLALRIAFAKVKDVAARAPEGAVVIAADTVVALHSVLYGKPRDPADAARMLSALSGREHEVITAIAIQVAGTEHVHLDSATTRVRFRLLSSADIESYVATREPMDKAGAYGIQGAGGDLVESIEGDYFNVVGLPCHTLADLLAQVDASLRSRIPEPPSRWRNPPHGR